MQRARAGLQRRKSNLDDLDDELWRAPQLCLHPIAIHPIKWLSEYIRLWTALDLRDQYYDQRLEKWRLKAAAEHAKRRRAVL